MEVDGSAARPCDVANDTEPPVIHSDCLRSSAQAPVLKARHRSSSDRRAVEIEYDRPSPPLRCNGVDELGRVAFHRHPVLLRHVAPRSAQRRRGGDSIVGVELDEGDLPRALLSEGAHRRDATEPAKMIEKATILEAMDRKGRT